MRGPDYFLDPKRVQILEAACSSWVGTPFRQNSRIKGGKGGVDCGNYVAAVLFESGAIDQQISTPPYDADYALYSEESVLLEWFKRPATRQLMRQVDEDEPHVDGDLVFPKVGRTEHHMGIRIGPWVWHVPRAIGVVHMAAASLQLSKFRYRAFERP
jgi:hypothetical protein